MGSRCVGWVRGETVRLVIHPEKPIGCPNPTAARPHLLPPSLISATRTLAAAHPHPSSIPGTSSSSSVYVCPELFLLRPHMLHPEPRLFHPTRTSPRLFAHQFKGQGQRAVESPRERRERQRRSRGNQEGQGAMEGAHGRTNPSRLAPNPQLPQSSLLTSSLTQALAPLPSPSFPQPQELRHYIRQDPPPPQGPYPPQVARKPRKEEISWASPAGEGGEARMPAKEADRLASTTPWA